PPALAARARDPVPVRLADPQAFRADASFPAGACRGSGRVAACGAPAVSYLWIKWLHLLGSSVLFGTGLGIAFFAWFGYRRGMEQGDIGLIRGVLRLTVLADTVFTATAAALQPVTGYLLWRMTGGQWPDRWLLWVLALYVFVG